ncbi:MAG: hypothetical protein GY788_17495 [bacterium]|nr:hypothetical protein [bacterium]
MTAYVCSDSVEVFDHARAHADAESIQREDPRLRSRRSRQQPMDQIKRRCFGRQDWVATTPHGNSHLNGNFAYYDPFRLGLKGVLG